MKKIVFSLLGILLLISSGKENSKKNKEFT